MLLLRPRKNARRSALFALLAALAFPAFALAAPAPADAERGLPPITRFKPGAYRGINWIPDVTVTPAGLVVLGGSYKVIVYDGHTFEHVPVPATYVTQLTCDAAGTVWLGADDVVGVLAPDPATGALRYVPRLDALPPGQRAIGVLAGLASWRDGVCALTEKSFVLLTPRGARAWTLPPDSTGTLHVAGGHVYLHRMTDGLTEFDGEKLTPPRPCGAGVFLSALPRA